MRHAAFLVIFCALLGISACKNKKDVTDNTVSGTELSEPLPEAIPTELPADSLIVYYDRGSCFGTCPVFTLSVYRSGLAVYEGRQFVDKMGRHSGTMAKKDINAILDKASAIGFFEMQRRYDNPMVSDLPGTAVKLQNSEGQIWEVYARYQYPPSLSELYEILDKAIENTTWKSNESKQ